MICLHTFHSFVCGGDIIAEACVDFVRDVHLRMNKMLINMNNDKGITCDDQAPISLYVHLHY